VAIAHGSVQPVGIEVRTIFLESFDECVLKPMLYIIFFLSILSKIKEFIIEFLTFLEFFQIFEFSDRKLISLKLHFPDKCCLNFSCDEY